MEYLWALVVITTFADINDAKYTHIATFRNRHHCEIVLEHFYDKFKPFKDNEVITCIKVDE